MGLEEDIARRILEKHRLDPDADRLGDKPMAGWMLLRFVKIGVKEGLREAARVKPEAQLPKQTKASLGGEETLTWEDVLDLDVLRQRVFDLLKNGKPRRIAELREVGGDQGDRRARALRPLFFVAKKQDDSGKRLWRYTVKLIAGHNYGNLDVSQLEYATPEEIAEYEAKKRKGT